MSLLERTAPLAPPPRRVPLALAIEQALGTDASVGAFGISFFLLIFVLVFALRSELVTMLEWHGRVVETTGEVVSVSATSSRENKSRIYEVTYRYSAGRATIVGESYGFGAAAAMKQGARVPVEVIEQRPEVSRIKGLRRRPFGAFAAFPAVFWVVLQLVGFGSVLEGLGRLRLLKTGRLAWGRLIERTKEKRGKNSTVHLLTFEYAFDEGGPTYRTSTKRKVQTIEVTDPTQLIDDPEEPMLCDPNNPEKVLFIDQLPAGTSVSPAGQLEAPGSVAKATLVVWGINLAAVTGVVAYVASCLF